MTIKTIDIGKQSKTAIPGTKKSASLVQKAKKQIACPTTTNPFKVERGIEFAGNRTPIRSVSLLKEVLLELPVDKKVSVVVPLSEASSKVAAANLFLNVKRILKKDKNLSKLVFTVRAIKDAQGNYIGSRIWRLA
jgi:hypothetical protein